MTHNTDDKNGFSSIMKLIKEYAGLLAILVGFLYAIGFIITNIYLGKYFGIYNFSILKNRHIFSGSFFIVFVSLVGTGSILLSRIIFYKTKTFIQLLVKVLILIFFMTFNAAYLTFIVVYIGNEGGVNFSSDITIFISIFLWFLLATIIFTFYGWILKKEVIDLSDPFTFLTSFILTFTVLISSYTRNVYRYLPLSIGGGKPIPIQLKLHPDAISSIEKDIPMKTEHMSKTVYLVEQNPDSLYVFIDHINSQKTGYVLKIDKTIVLMIRFQDNIDRHEIIYP